MEIVKKGIFNESILSLLILIATVLGTVIPLHIQMQNTVESIHLDMRDFHGRLERQDAEFKGRLEKQDAEFKSAFLLLEEKMRSKKD